MDDQAHKEVELAVRIALLRHGLTLISISEHRAPGTDDKPVIEVRVQGPDKVYFVRTDWPHDTLCQWAEDAMNALAAHALKPRSVA